MSNAVESWEHEATNQTGYIETHTGRLFYPMKPRAEDVSVEDIAHALAMKCRYTGHTRNFYSVAEHSVLLAEHFEERRLTETALVALLHDATEAYLPDVPRPVKIMWPWWDSIENAVAHAIAKHFGMESIHAPVVKNADSRILLTEAKRLMPSGGDAWGDWKEDYTPLPVNIRCWTPARAKDAWLGAYARLRLTGMP